MNITELTFRLALLFLPGFFALVIVESLTGRDAPSTARTLLYSLLLGLVAYLVYFLVTLLPFLKLDFNFSQTIQDQEIGIDYRELALVTLVALVLGVGVSAIVNSKVLHRVARAMRTTRRFGDADVWSHMMNTSYAGWAIVRDSRRDRLYWGWIEAYSDAGGDRELLLTDVEVYTNTDAKRLYHTKWLYLSDQDQQLIIESGEPVQEP